jgi:eukaryotic-like serine/threonine-protein kinase
MQVHTSVGGYEITERLGSGGMGVVWRGRDPLLDRNAAIKLMRVGTSQAEAARARFEAEARITAALSSPHTVRVFERGTTSDGDPFYAMELLVGCDFAALVRRFGPLSQDRALHLLAQVCDAIAELHQRGYVHGDIKPANLYTCRQGLECDFAKVLDFGLARPEYERVGDLAVADGPIAVGTPAYMAPEAIFGGPRTDRRTDVYALGCVAFYLLTGQLVFEGETTADVVWQHLNVRPDRPSTRTECVVSREVDALVLACLAKDPNKRPQDAADLKYQIENAGVAEWTPSAAKRWWRSHLPEC